jgi:hypothetical protein
MPFKTIYTTATTPLTTQLNLQFVNDIYLNQCFRKSCNNIYLSKWIMHRRHRPKKKEMLLIKTECNMLICKLIIQILWLMMSDFFSACIFVSILILRLNQIKDMERSPYPFDPQCFQSTGILNSSLQDLLIYSASNQTYSCVFICIRRIWMLHWLRKMHHSGPIAIIYKFSSVRRVQCH